MAKAEGVALSLLVAALAQAAHAHVEGYGTFGSKRARIAFEASENQSAVVLVRLEDDACGEEEKPADYRLVLRDRKAASGTAELSSASGDTRVVPLTHLSVALPELAYEQYTVQGLDPADPTRPLTFRLFEPLPDGRDLAETDESKCPDAGWEDDTLMAVVIPNDLPAARAWALEHQYALETGPDYVRRLAREFSTPLAETEDQAKRERYRVYFSVPQGAAKQILGDLRRQPWAIRPSRESIGAGPDFVSITFRRKIFTSMQDPGPLGGQLEAHLRKAFPKAIITQKKVGKGLRYSYQLEAPAAELGVSGFKGWWLRANVGFSFSDQGRADGPRDRLEISVNDGWLAKFPETSRPPAGYGAHLSPDGRDKYSNFSSLVMLSIGLAERLGGLWKADEIDTP